MVDDPPKIAGRYTNNFALTPTDLIQNIGEL